MRLQVFAAEELLDDLLVGAPATEALSPLANAIHEATRDFRRAANLSSRRGSQNGLLRGPSGRGSQGLSDRVSRERRDWLDRLQLLD
jgi:hypothetical protein